MSFAAMNSTRSTNWASHLIGATLMLLLVWGSTKLIFQPLRMQETQLQLRAEQLEALFAKTAVVQKQHQELTHQLEDLRRAILNTQGRLSPSISDQQFDQLLRQAAQEAGVEELQLEFGPVERTTTHGQAVVEFNGIGSYASICRFLAEAAELPRVTKVAEFHINSDLESARNRVHGRFVWYFEVGPNDKEENRGVR